MTGRTLSHENARRFYDRFGSRQDCQSFYEWPAVERLLSNLGLGEARSVVEFGCGTGRLAAELLADHLGPECSYLGLDVSTTMVALARARVAPFGARAEIRRTNGAPRIEAPAGAFDRFVSTYVFDLLSREERSVVFDEAHRLLAPGGRLGVASLTRGRSCAARAVSCAWERVHRLSPALVGGCRPIELAEEFPANRWKICHRSIVSRWAIASEVVVAEHVS